MSFLLNVLWAILGGGIWIALHYVVGGAVLCVTVIGIPFGLQCFKLAALGLCPFGKDLEDDPGAVAKGGLGIVMNVIWIVFGGLSLFLSHVALGLALAATVIGIPFAVQHLKLGLLALVPFGHKVVSRPW